MFEEDLAISTDGRERPWRVKVIAITVDDGAHATPARREAGRLFSASAYASAEELRQSYRDRESEYPADWRTALDTNCDVLHATPEELRTLQRRLIELFLTPRNPHGEKHDDNRGARSPAVADERLAVGAAGIPRFPAAGRTADPVWQAGGHEVVMSDEVTFSPDLYRGTAEYYDRFRLAYPDALVCDLVRRTGASGAERLLDLACGTGQLAFALRSSFAEVWAVDQEPDMIEVVGSKAAAGTGARRLLPVVSSAEELDAPSAHFSLVVIGNAFHRLPRKLVAGRVHGWLRPGGFLALCWSSGTQAGPLDWQVAFNGLLRRWQTALGGGDRVPANWSQARQRRPDADVLAGAGFELDGRFEFLVEHRWTLPELAGFARSLSVLPASALAGHAAAFDAKLAAELGPYASDGYLTETVSFAYDLGRRPA